MAPDREQLLTRAASADRESKYIDFKSEFDIDSPGAWCEIIKDIVAFANSGGGIIIFGVDDDGMGSDFDVSRILSLDVAKVSDKVFSYTGHDFSEIEILELNWKDKRKAVLLIGGIDTPMVFSKTGRYAIENGKQKTAFYQGTVYFRRGTKCAPANREDLVKWRNESIRRMRQDWLGGIRKVVEAPEGHVVTVASPHSFSMARVVVPALTSIHAGIGQEPGATPYIPANAEEVWPHRQKDLIREVNNKLPASVTINAFDVLCINRQFDVLAEKPNFAYKPYKLSSPQYSNEYVDWIVDQYRKDKHFFQRVRARYRS